MTKLIAWSLVAAPLLLAAAFAWAQAAAVPPERMVQVLTRALNAANDARIHAELALAEARVTIDELRQQLEAVTRERDAARPASPTPEGGK